MGADHPDYGDLSRMGELPEILRELGSVPSRASKAIAADLTELLRKEYEDGADPYGETWAPLKKRTLMKHGPPALTDTGRTGLAAGTRARALPGAGIILEAPFPAGIHMTGAGTPSEEDPQPQWGMEARPMFPTEEMPAEWEEVIERRISEAFGGKR